MKKLLKILAIMFGVVIAVFIIVGLLLPRHFTVSRSVTVGAPPPVVFALVNDLSNWETWSPWATKDPTMEVTMGEITVGEGGSYSWAGEESGEGSLTILKSVENEAIETALDFGSRGQANGVWRFEPDGAGTRVTWELVGDAGWNLVGRYFGLFMDRMVGADFENGLAALKDAAEGRQ